MSWWGWLLTGLAAGASWPWWFSAYFNFEDYIYERRHGPMTPLDREPSSQS